MTSPRKDSVVPSREESPRKKKGKSRDARSRTPEVTYPFTKEDEFSDVTIKVGGKQLYSNRCLLSYTSPVFMKNLSGGGDNRADNKGDNKGDKGAKGKGGGGGGGDNKGRDRDLDLSDKKYEDVCELLAFIDPRVLYKLTEDTAKRLLPLAEEYEIKGLLTECGFTITQAFHLLRKKRRTGTVPMEISLDYLAIADKYDFEDLRKMCCDECVATDTFNNRVLLDREDISETVKVRIIDRKYESLKLRFAREQRARSEMESAINGPGNKSHRK